MLDPRLSLCLGGFIFLIVGLVYPVDVDRVQLLSNTLQDLNKQLDLCKDPQCQRNIENLMSNAQTSLHISEIPGNTKAIFFFGGIIAEIGFATSLKFQ